MTLTELHEAMRRAGRDPRVVGYADDPESPNDEGNLKLRPRRSGEWEVFVVGRGRTYDHLTYPSESLAIEALAQELLAPRPVIHQTPAEKEASGARMQEKVRREMEELGQARGPVAWLDRWLERRADRRGRQGPRRGY